MPLLTQEETRTVLRSPPLLTSTTTKGLTDRRSDQAVRRTWNDALGSENNFQNNNLTNSKTANINRAATLVLDKRAMRPSSAPSVRAGTTAMASVDGRSQRFDNHTVTQLLRPGERSQVGDDQTAVARPKRPHSAGSALCKSGSTSFSSSVLDAPLSLQSVHA